MPRFYQRHKSMIDKLLMIMAVFLCVYVFVTYLFPLVAPFIIGFFLSVALEPLIRLLTKRLKLGRGIASAICLVAAVAAVVFLGATIVQKIVSEAMSFMSSVPYYITELEKLVDEMKVKLTNIGELIPEYIQEYFLNAGQELAGILTASLGTGVKNGSWNVVSNIPMFLMNFLICIISAFFFMKDRELIFQKAASKIPKRISEKAVMIKNGMIFALWGYIKAEFILISIIACIVIVGLLISGYPYALFLGLIIAFIDALPIFGSGIVLWPWAAVSFINGKYTVGVILLLIYGTVLITRQALEPRIVGSQIGVHPLLALVSMYVGVKLFGVLGFIIGPAIVVAVKTIYDLQAKAKGDMYVQYEK